VLSWILLVIVILVCFSATSTTIAQENKTSTTSDGGLTVLEQAQKSVEDNQKKPSLVSTGVNIPEGASSPTSKHFVPKLLTVAIGTSVHWTNNDNELHTVTSGSPEDEAASGSEFDSSYIGAGKTFEHTFISIGTFEYYCTLHPFMTGEVAVTEDGKPPITRINGTQTQADEILTYRNPDYDIELLYPKAHWAKYEVQLDPNQIVGFETGEKVGGLFDRRSTAFVKVYAYPKVGRNLTDQSEFITSSMQNDTDSYRLISNNLTQISNEPAHQWVLYDYANNLTTYKTLETIVAHGTDFYEVTYSADPGNFDKYLPEAETIIKSLKFISAK
jgi:plastocyanin